MTRTTARQIAVRICFSDCFLKDNPEEVLGRFFDPEYYMSLSADDRIFDDYPDEIQMEYIRSLVSCVHLHAEEIDKRISSFSEKRKLGRISKTALAVLRCAVCELLYFDDIPSSVTINEAVEISKTFDSPETVSFVNGLLGSVNRTLTDAQ